MNHSSGPTESVPTPIITSVISSGTKLRKSNRDGRIVN
jgi:hypothetical protein